MTQKSFYKEYNPINNIFLYLLLCKATYGGECKQQLCSIMCCTSQFLFNAYQLIILGGTVATAH